MGVISVLWKVCDLALCSMAVLEQGMLDFSAAAGLLNEIHFGM